MGTLLLQPTDLAVAAALATTHTAVLQANIIPGRAISKTYIDLLDDFISIVTAHTHALTDQLTLKDFGDGVGGTNTAQADVTSAVGGFTSITIAVGSNVKAADQNTLKNGANSMITHNHTFTDDP